MKVIDLSQPLENGMGVFPGAPHPSFRQLTSVDAGDVYQITQFEMTTHTGTHMDCTSHVKKVGYYTDTQDVSFFVGKGIVLDCSHYAEGQEMGMEIFDGVDLQDKEFVLLYCGWDRYWGQEKFFGNYPYISKEVSAFLSNHPTVRGIGVEYISLDPLPDEQLGLHQIFLEHEKTVVENLTNLDQLLGKDFTFVALPLKIKGGDGSPVRAVALLNE